MFYSGGKRFPWTGNPPSYTLGERMMPKFMSNHTMPAGFSRKMN
jgi:hypothetical protein